MFQRWKKSFVKVAFKRTELVNEVPNQVRGDQKTKNTISKRDDIELRSKPTNGRLKKQAHRNQTKLELATTKRQHKKKPRKRKASRGNRELKSSPKIKLSSQTGAKVEAWELHGWPDSYQPARELKLLRWAVNGIPRVSSQGVKTNIHKKGEDGATQRVDGGGCV